jgi:hypothetical protein
MQELHARLFVEPHKHADLFVQDLEVAVVRQHWSHLQLSSMLAQN